MLTLNVRKLRKGFDKLASLDFESFERRPAEMPADKWEILKRVLKAEDIEEVSDISDEQIIDLSIYLDDITKFFSEKGPLHDSNKIVSGFIRIPSCINRRRVF